MSNISCGRPDWSDLPHGSWTKCWECDKAFDLSEGVAQHKDKQGNWRLFCSQKCVNKAIGEGKLEIIDKLVNKKKEAWLEKQKMESASK